MNYLLTLIKFPKRAVSELAPEDADCSLNDVKNSSVVKVSLPRSSDAAKFAIVVKDVFSQQECISMIEETEKIGYEQALVNIGGGRQVLDIDYRKSSRCIVDSVEKAADIWNRVKVHVPPVWNEGGVQWRVVGLNERLRFLRYSPGDYFSPHCDGCYVRQNGERSFITLQLYLNEEFEGGATTFLDSSSDQCVGVQPKTGNVLIFQHDIYHSGAKVTSGRKYAVRTDIMYQKVNADRA